MDVFLIDNSIKVGGIGDLLVYLWLLVDFDAIEDKNGLYDLTEGLTNEAGIAV